MADTIHRRLQACQPATRTAARIRQEMRESIMQEGISTNRHCDTSAACLITEGRTFVFRYHSRTTTQPEKRLTPAEAAELARAGLSVACVYQDRGREPADFGQQCGEQDGLSAFMYAGQVGQPPGSAIYFAVDTDFSEAQLRSLVIPYFRGVQAALDRCASGASAYRIGVYGSGLTCRIVKSELSFVAFAWLAEAGGWRESATFQDWDVRQHVNSTTLCSLANAWEPCEAKSDDFGQFKPVGFALTKGQGQQRMVTALSLNLRVAPTTEGNSPVAALPQGTLVNLLGESVDGWSRVRCQLHGGDVVGYVSAKYLAAPTPDAHAVAALTAPAVPPVHLALNNPDARRNATGARAYPLGEPNRPGCRKDGDVAQKCQDLKAIADWMAVETSVRYQRSEATFCNVYAADYCFLADTYLPRVWWSDKALASILAGAVPPVAYGQTVREMRADDLHEWLIDYGEQFGWRRVFDATAVQAGANAGGVGLICADRAEPGLPGHISLVVAEDSGHQAARDVDGYVIEPLQTQAGGTNHRYGSAGPHWWLGSQFKSHVLFVHD
jgi:hypothetical protein